MPFSTLHELLRRQAEQRPGAEAILAPGRPPLTYAGLFARVAETASRLRAFGISPGERIAVVLQNGPEMAVAFLATACAAVSAPLNPAYTAEEYRFYLSDLNARALLLAPGADSPARAAAAGLGVRVLEILALEDGAAGEFAIRGAAPAPGGPAAPPEGGDCALVLHTSGTTSRPKLVPLTHANLCASAAGIAASLDLGPADRCLNVMPLFHIHGLVGALSASLTAGAGVICAPGFDDEGFFDWVQALRPSWYTAVPTMHRAVLNRAAARREVVAACPLRVIRSCSAALAPSLKAELEEAFGVPVVEAYGMTEASHQISINPLPPLARKPRSVGLPTGTEAAVMDEGGELLPPGAVGEIVIKGPGVTRGYEANPAANAQAFTRGWFRTGDQGYIDAEGYIFLTGRIKEIINRGGEKISPREIDEAFLEHPGVAQAVAFALPHPTLGQDVAVAVVPRSGALLEEEALREFAFERLAAFKVPSTVVIADAIPKGPTGKLQRIGLHAKLAAALSPAYRAPRGGVEKALAGIWAELLAVERVGAQDNFFLLGGDSILALRLVAEVKRRLGVELPPHEVFRAPTIAQMSRLIARGGGRGAEHGSLVRLSAGAGGIRLFCVPGTKRNVFADLAGLAGFLAPEHALYGFQDSHRNPLPIGRLAAGYVREMLAADRDGPHRLLGICSGAVVVFEMAQQLAAMGRAVAFLGMVEPSPPMADPLRPHIDFLRILLRRAAGGGMRPLEGLLGLGPEERKAYLRIRLRDLAMHLVVRRYRPRAYAGRIHLYLTAETIEDRGSPRLRWSAWCKTPAATRRILGTHNAITGKYGTPVSEAGMRSLATALRADMAA